MARMTLSLLLAFAGVAAHAQGPTSPPPDARPPDAARDARPAEKDASAPQLHAQPRPNPLPHGAILEELSGTVREVDRKTHHISVDASGNVITLSLDRNTMVYTTSGLGTALDIVPGAQIRAGRNADFLAYWVQVRRPAGKSETPSTPGQGTGPGGGAASSSAEGGAPVNTPPSVPGGASPVTPGPGAGGAPSR